MKIPPKSQTGNPNRSPHVKEINGETYVNARGLLLMIERTPPTEVKAGPSRDWIVDFQRRRPDMTEAEATREVLKRIGCEHLMPRPKALDGGKS